MGHGALGFGFGGAFFMPLFMIGFWLVLIFGFLYVARLIENRRDADPLRPDTKSSPLEALNLRYAKGEISKEQRDQIKRDIE